jgi:hypothetical protein
MFSYFCLLSSVVHEMDGRCAVASAQSGALGFALSASFGSAIGAVLLFSW